MASIFVVQVWIMPKEFYRGDSYALKMSAIHWLETGEMGIHPRDEHLIRPMLERKNQIFIQNPENLRYYAKWEFFNLVLQALPELFFSHTALTPTPEVIFRHNLMNALLAAVLGGLLFALAGLYTQRTVAKVTYVLFALFGSFTWFYLRAQSKELVLLLLFVAFFLCFVRSHRLLLQPGTQSSGRSSFFGQWLVWNLCCCLMCWIFSIYHLLYSAVVVVALWALHDAQRGKTPEPGLTWSKRWRQTCHQYPVALATLFLSWFGALGVTLFSAHARFATWLNPQGASWSVQTLDAAAATGMFGIEHVPERLYDYLVAPGFSLFLHFPLLVLAVFFARRFYRRYPVEAVLGAVCAASLLGVFLVFESVGEWCYGPRYLLSVLPILALPALMALQMGKHLVNGVTAAALLFSVFCQWHIHTRPFFMFYDVAGIIAEVTGQEPPPAHYRKHQGIFAWQMNRLSEVPESVALEAAFEGAFAGWPDDARRQFKGDLQNYLNAEGNNFLFQISD